MCGTPLFLSNFTILFQTKQQLVAVVSLKLILTRKLGEDGSETNNLTFRWLKNKNQKELYNNQIQANKSALESYSKYMQGESFNKNDMKKFDEYFKNADDVGRDFGRRMRDNNATLVDYENYIEKAQKKTSSFTNILSGLVKNIANMGISMLVSHVLEQAIKGIDAYINRVKYAKEALDDIQTSWDEAAKSEKEAQKVVKEYNDDYTKLRQGVNTKTNENVSLSTAEYDQYINMVNTIADKMPQLVAGWDAQGNAILEVQNGLDGLSKTFDEVIAKENRLKILGDSTEVMKNLKTTLFDSTHSMSRKLDWIDIFNSILSSDEKDVGSILKSSKVSELIGGGTDSPFEIGRKRGVLSELLESFGLSSQDKPLFINDVATGNARVKDWIVGFSNNIASVEAELVKQLAIESSPANKIAVATMQNYMADNALRFQDFNDEMQNAYAQIITGADLTKGIEAANSDGAAFQDWVQEQFLKPLLNKEVQQLLMGLAQSQKEFLNDDKTYADFMKDGQTTIDALHGDNVPYDVIRAISSFYGTRKEDNDQNAIIERVTQAFADNGKSKMGTEAAKEQLDYLNNLTYSQLQYLDTLQLTEQANLDMLASEAKFKEGFQTWQREQTLALDNLKTKWSEVSEAQATAAEVLKSLGDTSVLTTEQYNKLLEADEGYKSVIDASNGFLSINYDKLRAYNQQKIANQMQQLYGAPGGDGSDGAIAVNKKKLDEELKGLNELLEARKKIRDSDYAKLSENAANINAAQVRINSLIDEANGYRILAGELQYAASAYKRWLDAQEAPEQGDQFRSSNSALAIIKEGDETGRKNTERYKAATEYMFKEGITEKERAQALKDVESFYNKDGQLDRGNMAKAFYKAGVQDKNGVWQVRNLQEMANMLNLSEEYTAALIKAASEYEGSDGWHIPEDFVRQADDLINYVPDLVDALVSNTKAMTSLDEALDGGGGNKKNYVVYDVKDRMNLYREHWQRENPLGDFNSEAQQDLMKSMVEVVNGANENQRLILSKIDSNGNVVDDTTYERLKKKIASKDVGNLSDIEKSLIVGVTNGADAQATADQYLASIQSAMNGVSLDLPVTSDISAAQAAIEELRANVSKGATFPVTVAVTDGEFNLPNLSGGKTSGGGGAGPWLSQARWRGTDGPIAANGTVANGYANTLVGEIAPEIVVKKNSGQWFLASTPQIVGLEKGDIVFNGDDTKKILASKTSNVTGGRSFAMGTRYLTNVTMTDSGDNKLKSYLARTFANKYKRYGVLDLPGNTSAPDDSGYTPGPGDSGSGSGGNSAANEEARLKELFEKFKRLYDWISKAVEVAKNATTELINQVSKKIGYVAKNKQLDAAIASVANQINVNEAGRARYMQQAQMVAQETRLDAGIIAKIQSGAIEITEYDENTKKKIEEYKKWCGSRRAAL